MVDYEQIIRKYWLCVHWMRYVLSISAVPSLQGRLHELSQININTQVSYIYINV